MDLTNKQIDKQTNRQNEEGRKVYRHVKCKRRNKEISSESKVECESVEKCKC